MWFGARILASTLKRLSPYIWTFKPKTATVTFFLQESLASWKKRFWIIRKLSSSKIIWSIRSLKGNNKDITWNYSLNRKKDTFQKNEELCKSICPIKSFLPIASSRRSIMTIGDTTTLPPDYDPLCKDDTDRFKINVGGSIALKLRMDWKETLFEMYIWRSGRKLPCNM